MLEIRIGKLAKALGVHRNTVSNWIKKGKLKAVPTIGKRYLIADEDFIEFCRRYRISYDIIKELFDEEKSEIDKRMKDKEKKEKHSSRGGLMRKKPIGSVMVIGGGIAGIQATLDLADSGYYVYLVEKSSGIGGVMAQLDKTFPTNDCAM